MSVALAETPCGSPDLENANLVDLPPSPRSGVTSRDAVSSMPKWNDSLGRASGASVADTLDEALMVASRSTESPLAPLTRGFHEGESTAEVSGMAMSLARTSLGVGSVESSVTSARSPPPTSPILAVALSSGEPKGVSTSSASLTLGCDALTVSDFGAVLRAASSYAAPTVTVTGSASSPGTVQSPVDAVGLMPSGRSVPPPVL
mmetsp:Transcript_23114/g.69246  ORF Transcript_23114/g.69246 Transcript_23114/m.69246 type:complete len:204 (-) Transcript_23114:116-727(-)